MKQFFSHIRGAVVSTLYVWAECTMRAAGDTRTPLVVIATSIGLNAVLDPLLIFGIGPFPRLGVEGAVLATVGRRRGIVTDRTGHAGVEAVEARDLRAGGRRRAVDDPEVRAQRPREPPPWVGAEVGVLADAFRDERMPDLEQQRVRTGTEEEGRLAVEPPGLRAGAVEACQIAGRGRQRSLGRRPTSHHAAGNTAAAASSFTMSTPMNGMNPSSIAFWREIPVASASHGTPTA